LLRYLITPSSNFSIVCYLIKKSHYKSIIFVTGWLLSQLSACLFVQLNTFSYILKPDFFLCGSCLPIMFVCGCHLIGKQTKQHLVPLGFNYKQLLMYIDSAHYTSCCLAQWIPGRDRTKARSVPRPPNACQQAAAAPGSKFSKRTSFIATL